MQTITVSATHARNNFFDILNYVSSGKTVKVEKDKKLVAHIVPVAKITKNKGLLKALDLASKNFKYSVSENPLRRKGADSFLGKWDR
jgi:antitoxin (DNA-binding transcriptional repressor) of toxin-antitoxin stability system